MAIIANLEVPTGEISVIIYPDLDQIAVARRPDALRVESNYTVPNYGTSIGELAERSGFTIGWGKFPDGAEVIYLYDADDNCFGYAINLDAPSCSEWGYAPFDQPEREQLTDADMEHDIFGSTDSVPPVVAFDPAYRERCLASDELDDVQF